MRISHHIGFNSSRCPELSELLDKYNVAYERAAFITSFDLYEDSDAYAQLLPYIKARTCSDIADAVFSEAEMEKAAWYTVRCKWRRGYPMPDNDNSYLGVTYGLQAPYNGCRCKAEQCAPFQMQSAPHWGTRSFLMLNWVEDELFVSDSCAAILSKAGLEGFALWPVKNKNGRQTLQNIQQLKIRAAAPAGLDLEQTPVKQIGICRSCQSPIYLVPTQPLVFSESSIRAIQGDIAKTAELFGAAYGRKKILISRKFYEVIIQNGLERNLKIEPVLIKQ